MKQNTGAVELGRVGDVKMMEPTEGPPLLRRQLLSQAFTRPFRA